MEAVKLRRKLSRVAVLAIICVGTVLAVLVLSRDHRRGPRVDLRITPDDFRSVVIYDITFADTAEARLSSPRCVLDHEITQKVFSDVRYSTSVPVVKITFPGIAGLKNGEECRIGLSNYGTTYTILTIEGQTGYYQCQGDGATQLSNLVAEALTERFIPHRRGKEKGFAPSNLREENVNELSH